jgi:hypothetical protein
MRALDIDKYEDARYIAEQQHADTLDILQYAGNIRSSFKTHI